MSRSPVASKFKSSSVLRSVVVGMRSKMAMNVVCCSEGTYGTLESHATPNVLSHLRCITPIVASVTRDYQSQREHVPESMPEHSTMLWTALAAKFRSRTLLSSRRIVGCAARPPGCLLDTFCKAPCTGSRVARSCEVAAASQSIERPLYSAHW